MNHFRSVSSLAFYWSRIAHTELWSAEQKPENNLFGLERDRSDYKENNNPNSLGWAGDIYSWPAVTYIPLLRNTAGSQGGECGGGKPMTKKRPRKEGLQWLKSGEKNCVCVCVRTPQMRPPDEFLDSLEQRKIEETEKTIQFSRSSQVITNNFLIVMIPLRHCKYASINKNKYMLRILFLYFKTSS